MKPVVWIAITLGAIFVATIAVTTLHTSNYSARVCIAFNGRADCRTASASTRAEAQRAATTAACAQLAAGVSESIRCENTTPQSVEWLR